MRIDQRGALDIDCSHVLHPDPMPYGTGWSTDSTATINPFSILKTSAICHVHGIAGPETTFVPSRSVPLRASPEPLSKNANANPRTGREYRQPERCGRAHGHAGFYIRNAILRVLEVTEITEKRFRTEERSHGGQTEVNQLTCGGSGYE